MQKQLHEDIQLKVPNRLAALPFTLLALQESMNNNFGNKQEIMWMTTKTGYAN